jgi:hypothetical protein
MFAVLFMTASARTKQRLTAGLGYINIATAKKERNCHITPVTFAERANLPVKVPETKMSQWVEPDEAVF